MIYVQNINLPLNSKKEDAYNIAIKSLCITQRDIKNISLSKLSVDARHKTQSLVYTVAVELFDETKISKTNFNNRNIVYKAPTNFSLQTGKKPMLLKPVVCGFGPAGIFSALLLARYGFKPIVIERGENIEARTNTIDNFINGSKLNINSNIQFGEGGAGTFSDGKLTTRIGDELCEYITNTFLQHGAPQEIKYLKKPHIGTDILQKIIISIRNEIISLGGEILFSTTLKDLVIKNDALVGIITDKGELPCENLILAMGHSARDTFMMLDKNGLAMKCKPFSVGFRVEHLQSEIEKSLYHNAYGHKALPRGEYQLNCRYKDRGVYTFCMCPGGVVVAATSEENSVVVNGMSYHARDGKNANSAVVVGVTEKDFDGDFKKAIAFQRELEKKAFELGGGNYKAPAQNVKSYINNQNVNLNTEIVSPTYQKGVVNADLSKLFPQNLNDSLKFALSNFANKINGFDSNNAILTGVETRTSSPVRIVRDETFNSLNVKGIYPTGEGAGYAGGIVSAGVDGLKVARAIIQTYSPKM